MKHVVNKHVFTLTVLSEDDWGLDTTIKQLAYAITEGPDLGALELVSAKELTGRDDIERECLELGSNSEWFFTAWDDEDEEDE